MTDASTTAGEPRAGSGTPGLDEDRRAAHRELVDGDELLAVTSRAWGLPAVRLDDEELDEDLIRSLPASRLLAENWLPLRRVADGGVLVATARHPDHGLLRSVHESLGATPAFAVATSWDLRSAVLRVQRATIAEDASNELWKQNPRFSARTVLSRGQGPPSCSTGLHG